MTTAILPFNREAWLAARKTGIGGSDIAALLGLNPYKSAIEVYLDKRGLSDETPDNEAMHWGRILEEPVASAYQEIKGRVLIPGLFMVHPKFTHVVGTPDRLCEAEKLVVEIKTAGWRSAARWTDDRVPDEYFLQCMHYMLLTGFQTCDLAVLIGGQDFRIHSIPFDADIGGSIAETVEKFWQDNIEAQVPPAPDGSERAAESLKKLYPRETLDLIEAPAQIAAVDWPDLVTARAELKRCEEQEREAENKIKAAIGEHSGMTFPDGGKVTWTANKSTLVTDYKGIVAELAPPDAVIQKFTTTKPGARVFRVTAPKEK